MHDMSTNIDKFGNSLNVTRSQSIRCMCWNIQGLSDEVLSDPYFVQCLKENDIIVLTETWLTNQTEVFSDEFYNYHHVRPMHARARKSSGGISLY